MCDCSSGEHVEVTTDNQTPDNTFLFGLKLLKAKHKLQEESPNPDPQTLSPAPRSLLKPETTQIPDSSASRGCESGVSGST